MEKEQTTPEYYPMSLKAMAAASNQKTNRDPVMTLSDIKVLNVFRVLTQVGLVERESGFVSIDGDTPSTDCFPMNRVLRP